jgi:class 3 adenylate cyclase
MAVCASCGQENPDAARFCLACGTPFAAAPAPLEERKLVTVLFTDIVGSTDRAVAVGDSRWRDLLTQHHELVRRELARFRGREVDATGDGILASFDGPARAIQCAEAIVEAVRPLGIEIRAGVHTGECEIVDERLAGIAVHLGARVAAHASPGEVLVSRPVRDLVAGSGIEFEDRGVHALKGVPERQRLFAVRRNRDHRSSREPVWRERLEAAR